MRRAVPATVTATAASSSASSSATSVVAAMAVSGVGTHPAANDDDDECECIVVSPPRNASWPLASTQPTVGPAATGSGTAGGGGVGGVGGDSDDDDDEVVCVGVGRTALNLPHARHDCLEFPLSKDASAALRHCAYCWCALCEVSVSDCPLGRRIARRRNHKLPKSAAAKAEALQQRLASAQRPPPPPPGSAAAQLRADPRWHAMRFTALSSLTEFGSISRS